MNLFNTETELYGVIGHPVKHSKSPKLFNFLFQQYQINAVYLAFENQKIEELISSMKSLKIKGFSITIPHKKDAMDWIDEFGKESQESNEDKIAKKLACINTIFNDNGKLYGYNFDGYGAIDALIEKDPFYFKKRIGIIGNGGAARGIALSLMLCYKNVPKQIDILCRNIEKATPLINDINSIPTTLISKAIKLDSFKGEIPYEIIINTTPIGMLPKIEESPLNENQISSKSLVYDIVYTPKITQLLQFAQKKKAEILTGDNMFLGQASRQFKVWTGIHLSMKAMKKIADELQLFS